MIDNITAKSNEATNRRTPAVSTILAVSTSTATSRSTTATGNTAAVSGSKTKLVPS